MKLSKRTSLGFDDVHLLADRPSVVSSRNEVKINPNRIIMAPMNAIQGPTLIDAAVKYGVSVPIHRFNTVNEQSDLLTNALKLRSLIDSKSHLWLSVGMNDYKERIKKNKELLATNGIGILLDVANGYSFDVMKVLKDIRNVIGYDISLFAGNVNTWNGFAFLEEICDMIRVGIGPGEACLTTTNTGIGRGQLTAIDAIADNIKHAILVADGGIRNSGDLAKAFGAGADYVMIGGLFKNAVESECVRNDTTFFGGASAKAKASMGLSIKHVEGTEILLDKTNIKPLKDILDELIDGLKSAISYSGYDSLESFIGNAVFEVTL